MQTNKLDHTIDRIKQLNNIENCELDREKQLLTRQTVFFLLKWTWATADRFEEKKVAIVMELQSSWWAENASIWQSRSAPSLWRLFESFPRYFLSRSLSAIFRVIFRERMTSERWTKVESAMWEKICRECKSLAHQTHSSSRIISIAAAILRTVHTITFSSWTDECLSSRPSRFSSLSFAAH